MKQYTINGITVTLDDTTSQAIESALNPSKVWKPKKEEDYYLVNEIGEVEEDQWFKDQFDEQRYNFGNCFRTEEEAELHRDRLQLYTDMKRFAEQNNGEFEDGKKWFIFYETHDRKTYVSCYYSVINPFDVYFSSSEIADKAVELFGERMKALWGSK